MAIGRCVLTAFLILLMVNLNAQIYFEFENYNSVEITLPTSFKSDLCCRVYDGRLLNIGNLEEVFKKVSFLQLGDKWIDFLAEQDVINGWIETKKDVNHNKKNNITRKSEVNFFKDIDNSISLEIKFISGYNYSTNFNSYLFLIIRKDTEGLLESKDIYLLNEKFGYVLSIGKVASTVLVEGNYFQTYSIFKGGNTFILYRESLFYDVILPNEFQDKQQFESITVYLNSETGYFNIK